MTVSPTASRAWSVACWSEIEPFTDLHDKQPAICYESATRDDERPELHDSWRIAGLCDFIWFDHPPIWLQRMACGRRLPSGCRRFRSPLPLSSEVSATCWPRSTLLCAEDSTRRSFCAAPAWISFLMGADRPDQTRPVSDSLKDGPQRKAVGLVKKRTTSCRCTGSCPWPSAPQLASPLRPRPR